MWKHCFVPAGSPVVSNAVSLAVGWLGRSDQPLRIWRWTSYPVTVMVGSQVGVGLPEGTLVALVHWITTLVDPDAVAEALTGGHTLTLAADADADADADDADAAAEAAEADADDCRACTTARFTHWATLNND
jgi:hypothetical protein